MIHVDVSGGETIVTEISGNGTQILAELSSIAASLSKEGVDTENIIDAIAVGLVYADKEKAKAKAESGSIDDRREYVANLLKGIANE